jgi:hydroxymethylbilane synthase
VISKQIVIGSRGSDLALWQANFIKSQLEKLGLSVSIKIIKTQGDKIQHLSFDKMEGKGFFTKEIEEALLREEIDLAVHSHKDLETNNPEGLIIAAVSEREYPAELFLIHRDSFDENEPLKVKKGAVIGTSSSRRKSQLLAMRPDVILKDIRGNVPTRINKLRNKDFDAIMLASAGVTRLQLNTEDLESILLDPVQFVPAPAQGVMAIQIRENSKDLFEILQKINKIDVQELIGIEREVLRLMQGGCQMPLGAYCFKDTMGYHLYVSVADSWKDIPKRLYLQSKVPMGLAEKAVVELKKKVK